MPAAHHTDAYNSLQNDVLYCWQSVAKRTMDVHGLHSLKMHNTKRHKYLRTCMLYVLAAAKSWPFAWPLSNFRRCSSQGSSLARAARKWSGLARPSARLFVPWYTTTTVGSCTYVNIVSTCAFTEWEPSKRKQLGPGTSKSSQWHHYNHCAAPRSQPLEKEQQHRLQSRRCHSVSTMYHLRLQALVGLVLYIL